MKITSKALTGAADAVEQSQAAITESEITAQAKVLNIRQAKESHAALLHRLEMFNTEREGLAIELNTDPQELERLEHLISECQIDIEAAQDNIEQLKQDAESLLDTLEQEQDTRQAEATSANAQLRHSILNSDEITAAWGLIRAFWNIEAAQTWGDLLTELRTTQAPQVKLPELAGYRGSEVLEELKEELHH